MSEEFLDGGFLGALIGAVVGLFGTIYTEHMFHKRKRAEQNFLLATHLLSELIANESEERRFIRRLTRWWIDNQPPPGEPVDDNRKSRWLRPNPATSRAIFEAAGEKLVDLDPMVGRSIVNQYLKFGDSEHWRVKSAEIDEFCVERAAHHYEFVMSLRATIVGLSTEIQKLAKKARRANDYKPPEELNASWADTSKNEESLNEMIKRQNIDESKFSGKQFLKLVLDRRKENAS